MSLSCMKGITISCAIYKVNCMQMVTFLPLTESVSISLLCRYSVVANVFTIVSSPKPHYQWLTGRQHISDIGCFQVQ